MANPKRVKKTPEQKKADSELKRLAEFAEFNKNLPKKAFLIAYKKGFGNVSTACRLAGISRTIFYIWKKKDKKFLKALMEIEPEEDMLDQVEGKLYKKAIVDEDIAALIFLAKTKGKKRGYVERTEQSVTVNKIGKDLQEEKYE